ncbi:hypothetical protein HY989_04205 [Candidatus Micrarchaeota archaeon]|nr:hypothetical protein [Candidatus Micrarchaeota archaeon]
MGKTAVLEFIWEVITGEFKEFNKKKQLAISIIVLSSIFFSLMLLDPKVTLVYFNKSLSDLFIYILYLFSVGFVFFNIFGYIVEKLIALFGRKNNLVKTIIILLLSTSSVGTIIYRNQAESVLSFLFLILQAIFAFVIVFTLGGYAGDCLNYLIPRVKKYFADAKEDKKAIRRK